MNLPQGQIILAAERVRSGPASLESKITKLWALAMLDYRGPAGDFAWQQMREIAGDAQVSAISFLTGFSTGGIPSPRQLLDLVKEEMEQ